MINLVSTQAGSDVVTGPAKVFRNLVKGLDGIGYPYVVNRSLSSTPRVWVHDNVVALQYVSRSPARAVVGPNLYVLPSEIPATTDLSGALYIHPCPWAISIWQRAGFDACPMASWPVGIDLDEFSPYVGLEARSDVLVYHKLRRDDELECTCASLEAAGVRHRVVRYGSYEEGDYVELLRRAGLVVWLGRHESQGIALQEALAMDVPILVCDVTRVSQEVGGSFPPELDEVPVTAAPYFDATCGRRTYDLTSVGATAVQMLEERTSFLPRRYVEANLSLEGQARRFVELWNHFGLTAEEGVDEKLASNRAWRKPAGDRARDVARKVRRDIRRHLPMTRWGRS